MDALNMTPERAEHLRGLVEAGKQAYDDAVATYLPKFKAVAIMATQYAHPGGQKRGAIVGLAEPNCRLQVEALSQHIAVSERKALAAFAEAHPGEEVVWVQNWPLEMTLAEDGKGLKLSTRGGPSTRSEFEAFERAQREGERELVDAVVWTRPKHPRGIQYVEATTLVKVLAGELVPIVREGTAVVDVFAEVVGGAIGVKVEGAWIQAVPAGSVLPTVTDAIRFEPAARGYAGLDVNQERARTVSSSIDSTSPRRAFAEWPRRLFESHGGGVPAIGDPVPSPDPTLADAAQIEALQHACTCEDAVLMASGCQCGGV